MWTYTHKNGKGGGEKWGFAKKAKVSEIVPQESESTEKKRLYQEVETSQEEKEQILKSAEEIEQQRVKRFGGSLFQLREKIKVKYIHALNETAETIERVVVRAA